MNLRVHPRKRTLSIAEMFMASNEIPKNDIVPLDHVAEGIEGLRIAFVNVFGIRHTDHHWTLIDAGIPYSGTLIRDWAEKHFGAPPVGIVLTHGHFDHVSAAGELADEWNVPIYAHELEAPYLTGEKEYPSPNAGAGGGLMSLLSSIYPRGPVNLSSRLHLLFSNDQEIKVLPNWQIIPTPGHTPGHISFFRGADRTLIAGDAFCTTKPESFFDAAVTQPPELHGPPAYFTSNWDDAAISIRRLSLLRPHILAPGHGRPLAGAEVEQKFGEFASEFGHEIAHHGKS
jgi:glyoxylase-like metal-dependent hydrolase (beta-lactamase superfamily II)